MPPRDEDPSSLPPWIGGLSRLVTKHGIATVFACVLLWLLVFKLPDIFGTQLAAQVAATQAVERKLEDHATRMDGRDVEARQYERESLTLQFITCLNTSRTRTAEEMCRAVRR